MKRPLNSGGDVHWRRKAHAAEAMATLPLNCNGNLPLHWHSHQSSKQFGMSSVFPLLSYLHNCLSRTVMVAKRYSQSFQTEKSPRGIASRWSCIVTEAFPRWIESEAESWDGKHCKRSVSSLPLLFVLFFSPYLFLFLPLSPFTSHCWALVLTPTVLF